jgi:lipopolysaccharide heptosyltransferase II
VEARGCDNILVRGVNWIGDAVMTMPAMRALRRANPGAKITLLVKPWVSPLFEKDPNLDAIIQYSEEHKGFLGKLRLARELRRHRFCQAVLFQNAIDAAILSFLAGIPERIGYSRDGRRLLLTKPVHYDRNSANVHHIEYYLNLLLKAGLPAEKSLPWIYFSLDERLQARERLKALKRPVVAINPGATYGSSKRWHPKRFAEVAWKIINELGGSVIILGGPSETGIAGEIAGLLAAADTLHAREPRHLVLAGKTGLRDLAAVISESDILVTNDSGPMHIGYAVGTPVVAIFGSTSPEATGPAGDGNIVIRKTVDCSPCFERECERGDLKCMDLITTEDVYAAVQRLVTTRPAVFFDRDGTLCRDADYLSRMEDLEIFPGVNGLMRLKEKGYALIGVSNQSGIARGRVREDFVEEVNGIFMREYGFDGFYYCPHHPDDHCSCRKPEPGLLVRARNDFGIDLKRSFVVGDKEADILLAKAVGATSVHVATGREPSAPIADYAAKDLDGVVDIITNGSVKRQ